MSDSVQPHRQQPTRVPCPWDSPGKNTGVGCHFLLQCMKVKSESEVTQSCPTLSNPMDCSPPGSSIHGIFQPRVLEWGAIAFSRKLYTPCQLPAKGQCHRDRGKVTKHKHPNGTVSQFSRSVVSDSLRPHESQHARPPVHHQPPEFSQTHLHRVGDAIQPSHPLSSPSPPAPSPSRHQSLFQ